MWWALWWAARSWAWFRRPWPLVLALFGAHYVTYQAFMLVEQSGWAFRVWEQGLLIQNILAAAVVLLLVWTGPLAAKLIALLYLSAMVTSSLEVLACSTFVDPGSDKDLMDGVWGVTADKTACGRAYGWATTYAFPGVLAAFGAWVSWAWWRGRAAR